MFVPTRVVAAPGLVHMVNTMPTLWGLLGLTCLGRSSGAPAAAVSQVSQLLSPAWLPCEGWRQRAAAATAHRSGAAAEGAKRGAARLRSVNGCIATTQQQ